jgi:hydrogenase-4 membrane subunit HyfE
MSPQSTGETLQILIEILAVIMALIALGIISVGAIQQMIRLYQIQSLILALLTGLSAFELSGTDPGTRALLGFFALAIPGMLAYIIEPLLAQATVPREMPWSERLGHPFLRFLRSRYREEAAQSIREALPVWLEHGLSPSRQRVSAAISLLLTAIAYVLAFNLMREESGRAWDLAISMTLLMLGMFTMINRQDLISQIMGLLVMDHGLFLATVRVIAWPSLIPIFVVSLFFYILITLVILVILLPELHEQSATIEIADQKELRG